MPDVPTSGKKEQSLDGTSPRTGPGPHGGCRCSSFAPAIRMLLLVGLTAMVGSFCLLVGKTAVVSLDGSPWTCGSFAWTSVKLAAYAVPPPRVMASSAAPRSATVLRDRPCAMVAPLSAEEDRQRKPCRHAPEAPPRPYKAQPNSARTPRGREPGISPRGISPTASAPLLGHPRGVQPGVHPVPRHQLAVRAALHHPAAVEDDHLVRRLRR